MAGCITVQTAPSETTTPSDELPVIVEFSSDPPVIDSGSTSRLLWKVTGADSVSIDQGIGTVDVAGSRVVSPDKSTVYTIKAANAAGDATMSTYVTVKEAPLWQMSSGQMDITLPVVSEESGSMVGLKSLSSGESVYSVDRSVLCIGDNAGGAQSKAFLSFDVSSIPRNAAIEEVMLDISDCTKFGNPVYEALSGGMGAINVYHHQYADLDDTTMFTMNWSNRKAKLTQNGRITSYPQSPWIWDVKNSEDGEPVIQELVQTGQPRCRFMLEFFTSTNWNNEADMLCFNNVTLTIRYNLP